MVSNVRFNLCFYTKVNASFARRVIILHPRETADAADAAVGGGSSLADAEEAGAVTS